MTHDIAALRAAIDTAIRTGVDGEVAPAICAACAAAVPFDGMGVSVMVSDVGRETLFMSDATVRALDAVQYSLGEGPSMEVFETGRPALLPDVGERSVQARWPTLAGEPAWRAVSGVYCFPLRLGAAKVGVATMYRQVTTSLTVSEFGFTLKAVDLITLGLLDARDGTAGATLLSGWVATGSGSRPQVHQATGILMGRLGLPVIDAFARLRALAYAREGSLEQVAEDIVEGRIQVGPDQA